MKACQCEKTPWTFDEKSSTWNRANQTWLPPEPGALRDAMYCDRCGDMLFDSGMVVPAAGKTSAEGEEIMRPVTLHRAAAKGDTEKVKRLIDDGVEVDERDGYGDTPLRCAAERGHTETCKLLLEHGADPNAKNIFGMTPLNIAIGEAAELLRGWGKDDEIMRPKCSCGAWQYYVLQKVWSGCYGAFDPQKTKWRWCHLCGDRLEADGCVTTMPSCETVVCSCHASFFNCAAQRWELSDTNDLPCKPLNYCPTCGDKLGYGIAPIEFCGIAYPREETS